MPQPVGGKDVPTRKRNIRIPQWMDEFLTEEAMRREVTPSALIRLAVRRAFFSSSNDSMIAKHDSHTTSEAE